MASGNPARRFRIVVSGRVQGVWYRGSMVQEAERLGLAGWVKNRADGSVEAVVEGSPEALQRIIAWCRQGPPAARVERVDTLEEPAQGLVGFGIEY